MTNTLMPVRYSDTAKGIRLINYADTVVYDDREGVPTLCAIRFGGYPEQVEAMAGAIYGGGSVTVQLEDRELQLKTLEKR
jgi:hypothetical protein